METPEELKKTLNNYVRQRKIIYYRLSSLTNYKIMFYNYKTTYVQPLKNSGFKSEFEQKTN